MAKIKNLKIRYHKVQILNLQGSFLILTSVAWTLHSTIRWLCRCFLLFIVYFVSIRLFSFVSQVDRFQQSYSQTCHGTSTYLVDKTTKRNVSFCQKSCLHIKCYPFLLEILFLQWREINNHKLSSQRVDSCEWCSAWFWSFWFNYKPLE